MTHFCFWKLKRCRLWNTLREPPCCSEMEQPETARDDALLQEALSSPEGDLRAFEQLVVLHQRRIVADCRFMTRDESAAEDLAQEVFVKAFFGLRSFEGRSSFRHWLQRIKVHHCLNYLKRKEAQSEISIDSGSVEECEHFQVSPAICHQLREQDDRHYIAAILDALPSTLRIPLVMRDMDEMSYEEIASSLGIGLSAVKMRIKRAREEFRRKYESAAPLKKQQAFS